MDRKGDSLSLFHPLIGQWFAERLGAPTEIQERAWPVIAAGKHALVTAPTGSGKTLTAFLWAINQLVTWAWAGDRPASCTSRRSRHSTTTSGGISPSRSKN